MNSDYMKLAIALAKKGQGYVSPNPCVGAVIVKEDRIIGSGYHQRYGAPHAERNALSHLTEDASGAQMYVTLEPCCHQGKQPPCTHAIVESGIQTLYIGSADPNPLVAGKGIAYLRQHGIQVVTDVLKDSCDKLNPVFFHYITTKMPYIVMKYAMTMDGKIAAVTGESRWITGEKAREHAHQLRHQLTAILVGIKTVIKDDPMLTCRLDNCKTPLRIICDSRLRIPLDSQLVKSARQIPLIVAFTEASPSTQEHLEALGVRLIQTPSENGHVNPSWLMKELGSQGIDSILLEGGGTLNESFLKSNLVQRVLVYIAPKVFGSNSAPTPVGGDGILHPKDAWQFQHMETKKLGEDILLEYAKKP